MLEKKVKLVRVGEMKVYPKRENGNIVKDADGNDVVFHLRQVVFESTDYRKDTIPITLLHDEARSFSIAVGTEGILHFVCETYEKKIENDKETRIYADLKMMNFIPVN